MKKFILRRLGLSLVVLLAALFVIYALLRSLPASYVENTAMTLSQAPGAQPYEVWLEQLNRQYGLDVGIVEGYFIQIKNMLTGNFGTSWKYAMPVTEKFSQTIGVSVVMGLVSFVLELLIAIPLGVWAATGKGKARDFWLNAGSLLGISLPTFFFATVLKLIFSVELGWFDLFGLVGRDFATLSPWGKFWDMASHLVLPVLTMTLVSFGSLLRYTRTNMLEVLRSDYLRTARAKGLSRGQVIWGHGFRINHRLVRGLDYYTRTTWEVVSNEIGSQGSVAGGGRYDGLVAQLGGPAIPGIGFTAYEALVAGDIPFSMFYLAFLAALTLLGNLLGDICYGLADPRVRLSGGQEDG